VQCSESYEQVCEERDKLHSDIEQIQSQNLVEYGKVCMSLFAANGEAQDAKRALTTSEFERDKWMARALNLETAAAGLKSENHELKYKLIESEIEGAELSLKCAYYDVGIELKDPVVVYKEAVMPSSFLCPISMSIMRNPVLIPVCGHTFEASAITAHFNKNLTLIPQCPVCRKHVSKQTTPNVALRSAIDEFLLKTIQTNHEEFKVKMEKAEEAHAAALENQKKSLERDIRARNRLIDNLRTKVADLEKTICDKDVTIETLKDEISGA